MLDRPAKLRLAVLAILILVQTALEVVSIGLTVPFIALVYDPALVESNRMFAAIRHFLELLSPTSFLVVFGLGLFGLIVVKNAYCIWLAHVQARFCSQQTAALSTRLLERYLRAPYEYHLRRNSGEMISTADRFVDYVFTQVVMPAIILVTELAVVLGIVGLMLAVEPKLSLMLGTIIGGCAFVLAKLMKSRLTALGEDNARFHTSRMRMLQQALASIKDVKIMGREQFFLARYSRLRSDHSAIETSTQTLSQVPRPMLEIVVSGGIVLTVIAVLLQARANADIVAALGLFAMGAFRIMPGVNRILYAYTSIENHKSIVDRVANDVLDKSISREACEPSQGMLSQVSTIELRNVSFTYAGASSPALKAISLAIGRGEAIALVGPSGAGKSTLVDVLLGLLSPQDGQVLIDGRDVTRNPGSWRQIVGYVPQSIAMMDDTLRNNVAFGIEPGLIDDAQVWDVLGLAKIDDFVRGLPDGLDTIVGERGVRLSGGQRQRLGVARALYRNPEVLVLDEATSALDSEIERQVTDAIETLHGEKTVIVIAHRLTTVERCDRLVFIRDGTIVDSGTVGELTARNQGFGDMFRLESNAGTFGARVSRGGVA
jgi:ATP-binding cassette subfamily C protein